MTVKSEISQLAESAGMKFLVIVYIVPGSDHLFDGREVFTELLSVDYHQQGLVNPTPLLSYSSYPFAHDSTTCQEA